MTNFKDYLRAQKERSASTPEGTALSRPTEEWAQLKQRVRELAAGESYDGEQFLWSPYPAPFPEFLALGNVALSFNHRGRSASSGYTVSFGQRPLAPSEVFSSSKALEIEYRHLEPQASAHDFVWSAEEYKNNFSTEELADKLLIEFLEYYKRHLPSSQTKFGK